MYDSNQFKIASTEIQTLDFFSLVWSWEIILTVIFTEYLVKNNFALPKYCVHQQLYLQVTDS